MSWGGKVFKPSHSPVFKINDNYEGFLGEIISCRDHLQIPPECTTGCGVRWPPFPTSETANTIHFCPVLLTRKDLVLPKPEKRRRGKISWVHPLKVSPEGLWHPSLGLAPTPSGLGSQWCRLVQRGLLWVSHPPASSVSVHLLFLDPFE